MKIEKLIEEVVKKLLTKLNLKGEIKITKENSVFLINIDLPSPSILIGYEGKNLKAFQHILRLILRKKEGKRVNVLVNIGDFREREEKGLIQLAKNSAKKVKETGKFIILRPMNSFERRIVHLALAEEEDIETESVGEEPERRVIIRLKKPKK